MNGTKHYNAVGSVLTGQHCERVLHAPTGLVEVLVAQLQVLRALLVRQLTTELRDRILQRRGAHALLLT